MNSSITYVKLQSPYSSNPPKNSPLTVVEMDGNFATLEGRDVKSVTVENDILSINLYNGQVLTASIGRKESMVSDVVFDHINGTLTVALSDGTIKTIEGFATKSNTGTTVAVDNTLVGNGLPANPVGISPVAKTGWYRPVDRILNVCENQQLPCGKHVAIGERYLTIERVSDFGYLYDYNAVRKLACDLRAAHSPWRIPSKNDWDDMLDAIEPSDEGQTHSAATANKYLGMFAGKLLKSRHLWRKGEEEGCGCPSTDDLADPVYDDVTEDANEEEFVNGDYLACPAPGEMEDGHHHDHCHPMHCGDHHHSHCSHHHKWPFGGVDKYGFRVTPAGYADDGGNFIFFRERAAFWTSTNSNMANAYVKRFEYNKNTVHQDIIAAQNHLSIRLIKDYDGTNYNEREDILGQSFSTVIMPSAKKGSAIWTSVNVNFGHKCYDPMIPNDGQGMSFTLHFFINEWNGKEWVRNEVRDGESVTVKFAPDGSRNSEYRVIDGHLANVAKSLVKTVSAGMRCILNKMDEKIDNEITRSTETDAAHDLEINAIKNRLDGIESKDNEQDGNYNELKDKVEEMDTRFTAGIDELNQKVAGNAEKIENHEGRLTEAESLIQGSLSLIEDLTKKHEDNVKRLDNHEGRLTEAESLIQSSLGIIEEHAGRITELESKVAADEETIANHGERIVTLEGKVDAAEQTIADHGVRIEALETKSGENSDAIEDIYGKVDENKKAIEGLTESLAATDEKLNGEIKAREDFEKKAEETYNALLQTLPVQEGTEFDSEKGIITIKSRGGENDIKIQMKGNYGEF